MVIVDDLNAWLNDALCEINCSSAAKSYIVNVLSKPTLHDCSMVIKFHNARTTGRFHLFQEIGDETLFVCSLFETKNKDVELTMARLSYYACYRIMQKKWPLYEELADQLPSYTRQIGSAFHEAVHTRKKFC